jgi:hypothetical protein
LVVRFLQTTLGLLPLGFAERHCLDAALELAERPSALKDSPERHEVPVQIVDDFGDALERLGKKDCQAASVGLDVVGVRWHQADDRVGQVMLAAVELERLGHVWVSWLRMMRRRGRLTSMPSSAA